MSTKAVDYRVPAVERAFAMLELISVSRDGLRMSDLTRKMQIPKSSAFGLLRSLEGLGYVESDGEGRYTVAGKLSLLAQTAAGDNSIQGLARPALRGLSKRLQLPVHLAELVGDHSRYIDRVVLPGLVNFDTQIGKQAPARLTAVGKSMLALLSPATLDTLLPSGEFAGGTSNAPRNLGDLKIQLDAVRENGYAFEDQEDVIGVRCLAAAIRSVTGHPVAAVGCIGLVTQISDIRLEAIAAEVVATAQKIQDVLRDRSHAS